MILIEYFCCLAHNLLFRPLPGLPGEGKLKPPSPRPVLCFFPLLFLLAILNVQLYYKQYSVGNNPPKAFLKNVRILFVKE